MRALLVAAFLVTGCEEATGPLALHDIDKQLDFFALPFPNDLRLGEDGKIDLTGFPSGRSTEVDRYVSAFDHRLTGWGTQAAVFFRVDRPLDSATLPSIAGSIDTNSTVFLVDLSPESPNYGKQHPIAAVFHPLGGDYIGPNWLSVRPMNGLPLREKTTYAAIVTNDVYGSDGNRVRRASALSQALSDAGPAAYAPLRAWLKTAPKLTRRVANATVFTTQDATGPMVRLRKATYEKAAAPVAKNLTYQQTKPLYDEYTGEYDAPNFQEGEVPYFQTGGRIVDDTDGLPLIQRTETMRFCLTVPRSTMPLTGWPLVIYAHGTGGNYRSFINDKSADGVAWIESGDGEDAKLLSQMAMISIDQPLHGARDPSGMGSELFFNLFNVDSLFDNLKQGAADDFSLVRLALAFDIAAAPTTNLPLRFDPQRIYYKGHSQGGITGALFLPAEPNIKAAILSGTGGNIVQSLLAKEMYSSALPLLFDPPYDDTHPVLNLFQTFGESSDPTNYADALFTHPLADSLPKSVFVSMGLGDTDTPNSTTWSFAMAMGAQPILPMLAMPATPDALDLADLAWGNAPIDSNVAGGAATGVLLQYTPPPGRDGHFVIFDVAAARNQSNRFLAAHSVSGIATLSSP